MSEDSRPGWSRNGQGGWDIPTELYRQPLALSRPDTTPDGTVYASRADMHRDMADPRYRTDREFRRTVATKLAATQAGRQRR